MAEIRARSHTSGSWSLPRLGWEMNQCCLIFTPQPFLSTFTQNQNIIQFPFRRERERERDAKAFWLHISLCNSIHYAENSNQFLCGLSYFPIKRILCQHCSRFNPPSHRPLSFSKAVIILWYCAVCPTRSISMLGWGWKWFAWTSIQSDYYFKMKTIWQTII